MWGGTEGVKSQVLSWKDKGPLGLFILRVNIVWGRKIQEVLFTGKGFFQSYRFTTLGFNFIK